MKIVKPYAKILTNDLSQALFQIEAAARVSHASEDAQKNTIESALRFIKAVVIDHGDWSVVEHVSVSVEFLVDRGITHEIVRHRLFSFTQSSTRFINYVKKMPPEFIYPIPGVAEGDFDYDWGDAILVAEAYYKALLSKGWRPQEARSVFPNALASKLIMTGNLRNWRYFLSARTSAESHPQMREVTIPLLKEFQSKVPILFDDIVPGEKQNKAFSKPR